MTAKAIFAEPEAAPSRRGTTRFSNNQWYLNEARQTVFFAAFSPKLFSDDDLLAFARGFVAATPQLAAQYRAQTGKALDDFAKKTVIASQVVTSLAPYPDAFPVDGGDLFTNTDLPPFRITAAVCEAGTERRTALCITSTHALLEGADSALLTRSQAAGHDGLAAPAKAESRLTAAWLGMKASFLTPLQLLAALIIAPRKIDRGYESLAIPRDQLRRVATKLKVSQRTLVFAASAFVLNDQGKGFSSRSISTIFADLEGQNRVSARDEFFRYRMIEVGFPVKPDFLSFLRAAEQSMANAEAKNPEGTQALLNRVFAGHRWLKAKLPFLYPERIFRFTGFYHLDLSLTPPHRLEGDLTKELVEPVYCGSFHPGLNVCVFVPGKKYISFNFTLAQKHLAKVAAIGQLIADLDGH